SSRDGTVTKASSERYRNQNPSNQDHYSQQAVRPPRPQDRSSPQALRLPQGQSTQSTQYHHYQRVQPRAVHEPARVLPAPQLPTPPPLRARPITRTPS